MTAPSNVIGYCYLDGMPPRLSKSRTSRRRVRRPLKVPAKKQATPPLPLPLLLSVSGGHFRFGDEADFPWRAHSGVWYFYLARGPAGLTQKGFTSTKDGKWGLLEELGATRPDQGHLFGVWTGKWDTHVFVLDRQIAIARLSEALGACPQSLLQAAKL